MRFGLNGATTGLTPLLRDLEAARRAGYDDLEIRDAKLEAYLRIESLADLRARMADLGVRPLSLNAIEDATLGDPMPALHRARTLFGWAQSLGAPYVVAVPSPAPSGASPSDVAERTATRLASLADVAAGYGVAVGFEFLGFPWCSVRTVSAARQIVGEAGRANLGLVLDAFHFHVGGSTIGDVAGLQDLRIVHLDDAEPGPPDSLADAQRLLPGEGAIPLRDLVRAIRKTGYDGSYSLELFRPEYYRWDPDELARRGLAAMKSLFD